MATSAQKEYDIILFGATGYTGKLCAEHITLALPTDLKWAVAGRSASKLYAIVDELKSFNRDRRQPGIETATLSAQDLDTLVKKTRVLINTVGPYHLYGGPVVEACVKNGTHYVDATGETPWLLEMIKKHHETAKANNAIIIPEAGVESVPSDLLALSLASFVRGQYSVGLKEVVCSLREMKSAPSGGTLATILSLSDQYSHREIDESMSPWALSPLRGPKSIKSLVTKIFGLRFVPQLGTLTTSVFGASNTAIVQRSWGLLDGGNLYGSNFNYEEYMRVSSSVIGVGIHFATTLLPLALYIAPLKWLLKKLVLAPGEGPAREVADKDILEYQAIGTAEQDLPHPKKAMARLRYEGGVYYFTGLLLAEAAMVILRDEDEIIKKFGGGVLTPATLGQPYIDRLCGAGVIIEALALPDE